MLIALALVMTALPALAMNADAISLTKTPVGNTGAVITVSGGSGTVTAVSSDTDIATVSVSGTTVTVTGVSGAVGVAKITVTRGSDSKQIEVPIGYTTFSFSGRSVTVYDGSSNKYEVLGIEQASETEFTGSEGTGELTVTQDANGNSVYTAAAGYELSVNIKKAGGTFSFNGSSEYSNIMIKKESTGDANLLFDGVSIKSQFTAALTVKKDSTAAVYVRPLAGTTNTLADSAVNNADTYGPTSDGGNGSNQYYAESAVIKGKTAANLVITGEGALNINAAAKNGVKIGANGLLTVEGSVLTVNAPNAGLSSENELLISGGTVSLTTTGDAIKAADDTDEIGKVFITGGSITVNSNDEGILAREKIEISGGTLNITAAGDGIKAENSTETSGDVEISGGEFELHTTGDGITGFNVVISGGEFDITCANGYTNTSYNGNNPNTPSAKCIKAELDGTISGGTFTLSAPDDTIHSDGNVSVLGGTFDIWTRDDGVHSELVTTFGIRGASDDLLNLTIHTCYEGIEGADVVLNSGHCTIYSTDDLINAANGDLPNYNYTINVWGGVYRIYTNGGDGVDSNGGLFFRGGDLEVYSKSNTSNDPLDSDGMLALYDGTVLACGQNAMQGAPDTGIYVQFTNCSIRTGYSLVIKDSANNILKSTQAYFADSNNTASYVVFSHPDMVSGQTYYLYINGSSSPKTATAQGNHVDSTPWVDLDTGDTDVYERVTSMTSGSRFIVTNASANSPVYTLGGTSGVSSVQSTITSVPGGGFTFGTVNDENTYRMDESGHIYNTVGGVNYYLAYTSTGGWNPTYNIAKTTDANSAAAWEIGSSGSAATVSCAISGGPGGGPGGQSRRLYLYCQSGTWRVAASTSASGYTVYVYAPSVAQAALTGTLYYSADVSDGFSMDDVFAGTVIKYRTSRTGQAVTVEWTSSHITYSWEPELDSAAAGTYLLTVCYDGIAFGTLTAVITGGTQPPDPPQPPEYVLGDANGDGAVDISDALLTLRYAMSLVSSVEQPEAADVNGDGTVGVDDALMILRAAMGLITLE